MDLRGFAEGVAALTCIAMLACACIGMGAASLFHTRSIVIAKKYESMNVAKAWELYIEQQDLADQQLEKARQEHAKAYGRNNDN